MVNGVRATVDLALEINREVGRKQITSIDIGGGYVVCDYATVILISTISTTTTAIIIDRSIAFCCLCFCCFYVNQ